MPNLIYGPTRLGTNASTSVSQKPPPVPVLLQELLNSSIILAANWEALAPKDQEELPQCAEIKDLVPLLVKHQLVTAYQAERIAAGTTSGLILGNYRVLEKLGAGGMGVVLKGEHLRMRRLVAIKVLQKLPGLQSRALLRFLSEMRAVAQLQHPNIVSAIDDGETAGSSAGAPGVHFFVMEYVPGDDVDVLVRSQGPLTVDKACGIIYQIAGALAEAHKHDLVHRDIKPSNIRITPDGQAKLLDFGLVRQHENRMTEPGTMMGTVDYLAPEQAQDASSVDIRADIYGLGGTLYWCLAGQPPFPGEGNIAQKLLRRLSQPPPCVRTRNPKVPAELQAVLRRMMATHPDDRYPTPQAVMNALLGFLKPESWHLSVPAPRLPAEAAPASVHLQDAAAARRILVVDDSRTVRQFCCETLQEEGLACDGVANGPEALAAIAERPYALVLSDWNMPEMSGFELCRKLRENPPVANLKVILFSAVVTDDEVAQVLAAGADDFLSKQFTPVQLVARVQAALRMKESQDRADALCRQLLVANQHLERSLTARDGDLVGVRSALVLGLADLGSRRDVETLAHVMRLQRYCRCLAEEASKLPAFASQIDTAFVQMLECCAPLHDIGKAGLPDHILRKVGHLEPDERLMMQAHTVLGAETLQGVAQRHGSAVAFLQMAIDIARHHHERFDGKGYPDQLAGNAIPLAARITTIGDVYDALRSRLAYKPALSHPAAMKMMMEASPGQFDPLLLQAFQRCASRFEQTFAELPG